MFRSLRFSLLFWYAVVLLGSITVLGTVLHQELRGSLYREADAQLGHWLEILSRDASQAAERLPPGATYAVFDGHGECALASPDLAPAEPPRRAETVTRDHVRWRSAARPDGGWLLVGRSVRDENHGIRRFLIVLLATGTGIVVLALAGGFLLISRILAPARAIAKSARRIATGNLAERLPSAGVPSELEDMVETLNESFARLEAAFSRQVRFTADASHELRTPLAIAMSHLELAETVDRDEEQVLDRLAICRHALRRMQSLVAGLLTLARADAGELSLELEKVDLGALVAEECRALKPLADARGISIDHRLVPADVRADRDRLSEVVANLLDNGIRHNREGGGLTVTVTREDDLAVLRVADTGPGIPAEYRERIFDRFYRVDPARSGKRGGSGLGLAIARWIVERHGGSLSVQDAAGGGSEFVVRLPMAE